MPLRADAQRNLGRVLDAAAEAFAEHGADVSVDEIARRAGVGHATVFRRFPTKDALIEAVVLKSVSELVAAAEAALEEPDAGEAFRHFVWRAAELQSRDRALFEGLGRCVATPEVGELQVAVAKVVARAGGRRGATGRGRGRPRPAAGLRDPRGAARPLAALRRGRARRPPPSGLGP